MATFQKTVQSYRQGAQTMPRERYVSPDIFAQDLERIHAHHWNCVGRASAFASATRAIVESRNCSIFDTAVLALAANWAKR